MPTRKSIVSKAAEVVPSIGKTSRSRKKTGRRASSPTSSTRSRDQIRRVASDWDWSRYVTPGAAVLASGALAATGYFFRDQLGEVVVDALATAAKRGDKMANAASKGVDAVRDQAMDAVEKATHAMSIDSLLKRAGLQRRSTVMSVVGPAIGVACGFAIGSAFTFFLGPRLLEELRRPSTNEGAHPAEAAATHDSDAPAAEPAAPSMDDARTNGGFHRGIS